MGIVVCDEGGTVLFVNRRIEKMFGYESIEVVGRSVSEFVPEVNGSTYEAAARKRVAGVGGDLEGRRKDGSRIPVEVDLAAMEYPDGRLVVASVVDVSDRLHLQSQLVQTSREYAEFERLITDLAARFVMVEPDQVDDAIVESLRQIAVALDLDRSTWWRVPKDGGDALVTHTWTRPEYRIMQSGESASLQVPWLLSRLRKGEIVSFSSPDELPSLTDRDTMRRFGTKSGAAVPFFINGQFKAILGFSALRHQVTWPPEIIDRLRLVAAVFGQALVRKANDEELQHALAEVQQLRDQLKVENVQLRREVKGLGVQRLVVAESLAARRVLEQIESVAPTDATVLLLGETGTGKEVFAHAIHRASERRGRQMVTVNCGAIPSTLLESELFGRERGAYTGALARQIGRFEMAHESTIFLDEIGELTLEAQVKLLRVLQDKVIERLGGGHPVKVDVRIIAATNRNLEKAVENRTFREDLFYRLNVFPITIPPLRERIEDITALVWTFIEEYSTAFRKPIESISKESLAALKRHGWPGNVRELRNVIERAVIVTKGPRLVVDLPTTAATVSRGSTRLDELESEQIRRVLESVGWRVRGPGGAAELLGIKPNTLDSRMVKLGIRRQPRQQIA
jgi:PAS domain S-box-containing protein